MKEIAVGSRAQFSMIVDDVDYDFLIQWPWSFARSHPRTGGELIYARRTVRVEGNPLWTPEGVKPTRKKFDLFVHHVVLARMGFPDAPTPDWTADHISGDTLDNRRANLRWASATFQEKNKRHLRHVDHVRQALAAMAPAHTLPSGGGLTHAGTEGA
jgi:hypothetical protein